MSVEAPTRDRGKSFSQLYGSLTGIPLNRRMSRYVYILASRPFGAIYIGSTDDLRRRVDQHRAGAVKAHTRRYGIHRLVWFEAHADPAKARLREHRLKRWRRQWKNDLIAAYNPQWQDLTAFIPD